MNEKQILEIIQERANYWSDMYNRLPINDRGENTSDFAKGSYMSLLELKTYIEHEHEERKD